MKQQIELVDEQICVGTIGGWTENLTLISLQLPVVFALTLIGALVVQRNRLDIPQYRPPATKDKGTVKEAEEELRNNLI